MSRRAKWCAASALLVLLLAIAWGARNSLPRAAPTAPEGGAASTGSGGESPKQNGGRSRGDDPFPFAAIRPSRFANTAAGVAYVGSDQCVACHENEHKSYLQTTHSRALGLVAPEDEPEAVEFSHALSGRTYRVVRQGKEVLHEESLAGDPPFVLSSYPVKYTIGSGHHSRSYLVEVDGFLVESPITWYTAKDAWGPSPGYDVPHPRGFERLADHGCLQCHAGRVEEADGSRFRVHLHDMSIGCESCHGPGALHVAQRNGDRRSQTNAAETAPTGIDTLIVNPAHLEREDREAVCAQCHMRGSASVLLRGRDLSSFRPGLKLSDFRIDYVLENPGSEMTVVGHVEQMRHSRCYQMSESMTCTSCHDPHAFPTAEERVEFYRSRCLTCHEPPDCGLGEADRLARNSDDNCVACHMPRTDTDIPHFAFTHHRVGLYELDGSGAIPTPRKAKPASPEVAESPPQDNVDPSHGPGRLRPLNDDSHLPEIERRRNLALAYFELADKQENPALMDAYRRLAHPHLTAVHEKGLRDADIESALARLAWEVDDLVRAIHFAESSLAAPGTSGAHANALFVLGDSHRDLHRPDAAVGVFQRLTRERRTAQDWVLLGECQLALGKYDEARRSMQRAAEIDPTRVDVRQQLARLFRAAGMVQEAERQEQAGAALRN